MAVSQSSVDGLVAVEISLDAAPVCLAKGTRILADKGETRIEHLKVGDLVQTLDSGFQPVRWIGSSTRRARGRSQPVRIARGAMGPGQPCRDLVLSQQHRVMIKSPIADRKTGDAEVLVAAKMLIDMPGVAYVCDMVSVTHFHLLCDRHELVLAEGAAVESLLLGPMARGSLGQDANREINALFSDGTEVFETTARQVPKGATVQKLLERHRKNAKCLVSSYGVGPWPTPAGPGA
ncbi:hypothetical protein AN189_13830 [Loktanella sp. 3ANDIMAR09]|nr:hypothetical protein AN189_13830 [Loktanella sp. 3ANDIMAR09]